jgi:hypothetical protein
MTAFASPDVAAVYAGHIFRGADMDAASQAGEEARLAPAIRDLLRRTGVRSLHGALAAGADILFAEAAVALGLDLHVVLPFDADAFEASSVEIGNPPDAPGRWNGRYRAMLAAAASLRLSRPGAPSGRRDAWYRTAFREAAGAALFTADRLAGSCVMIAVTDDGSSPSPGGTASAEADWRARGRRLFTLPFIGSRRSVEAEEARPGTGLLPVLFLRPANPGGDARLAAIRPALGEARPRIALAGGGEAVLFDLAADAIAGARLAADPSLRVICDFGLVSPHPGQVDVDAVLALAGAGDMAETPAGVVLASEAFALEARFESDSVAPLFPPDAFAGGERFTTLSLFGR